MPFTITYYVWRGGGEFNVSKQELQDASAVPGSPTCSAGAHKVPRRRGAPLRVDARIVKVVDPSIRCMLKDLYHELHALHRFEQDYRCQLKGNENSNKLEKGDNIHAVKLELKTQRSREEFEKKISLDKGIGTCC